VTDLARLRLVNLRQLRRRSLIARIHRLGPRPIVEPLEEFVRHQLIDEDHLDARLSAYAALDADALAATGGNRLPLLPVHLVR
jgi:hypothetical protein